MADDGILLELGVVAALILLNGFFAGAEIAIVSARPARLRALAEEGRRGAATALRLKEDPDRFLATVQIGVTLVSTMASAVGGVAAIERLEPAVASLPWPWLARLAEPIAVSIVVFTIAYLSLVIGELVPKSVAVRHAETLAVWVAPVIDWIRRVARPAVTVLTWTSGIFLRLLGQRGTEHVAFHHSLEDLRALAEEVAKQGQLRGEIVTGAVEFHDRAVREVMTARPRVAALPAAADLEESLKLIRGSGHTRYPVYEADSDDVLGFVHARDVYEAALSGTALRLRELVQPVPAVPGGKAASELLDQMRREGVHMAIVVDEHGSMEGLVTMEDLVEVIVGEIEDEHRVQLPAVRETGEGRFEVDGSVALKELNAEHALGLPESPDYVTIAGLVLDRLGHIPEPGATVLVPPHRLTVLNMEGRRVARLLVERLPPEELQAEAASQDA